MSTIKFPVETLTSLSCLQKIEEELKKVGGVKELHVLFYVHKVKVYFEETIVSADRLTEIISTLGYRVDSKAS